MSGCQCDLIVLKAEPKVNRNSKNTISQPKKGINPNSEYSATPITTDCQLKPFILDLVK